MALSLALGAGKAGWQTSAGGLTLRLPLPVLGGVQEEFLWQRDIVLEALSEDSIRAVAGPYIFVALKAVVDSDLAETTRRLYGELLHQMSDASLLRIWNFVPRINDCSGGEEHYRRFCTGRTQAFVEDASWTEDRYPAASAVGCEGEELIVYAFANRAGKVVHHENPLQLPAYHYPQEYGPDAPAFSRASVDFSEYGAACFISGTASVRGHATVHPWDLEGQLAVTAENIHAILETLKSQSPAELFAQAPHARAYIRRPEDAEQVEAWLKSQAWACTGQCSLVQADICREDLLVEVELSWFPVVSIALLETPSMESISR